MRILYAGSPYVAVPSLETLAQLAGCEIAGVLTNPDTPKGRHGVPAPTPVGAAAALLRFPLLKPEKLDSLSREAVSALKPDLLVSFAYGRIFGPKFLARFPLGGINIHPSLLPKYRGASPIQSVILNREHETGISVQRLALKMDSGAILLQERFPLSGRETTESLSETVSIKAADMLTEVLKNINTIVETVQNDEDATYCSTITKDDGLIDWSLDAKIIDARLRAFTAWPLSWTTFNGENLLILEAHPFEYPSETAPAGTVLGKDKQAGILVQTGRGILAITRLQLGTRKPLDWKAFLNGARNFIGTILGKV
jgi:methionyl-tRNA formyltransferase